MQQKRSQSDLQRIQKYLTLGSSIVLIAIVWGTVLPWIGSHCGINERMENLDSKGIDPSALYYTELEIMESISDKIEEAHRRHGKTFWQPSH